MRDDRADLLRWCGWFFLCAAALFVLLALRYLGVVNLPAGVGARAFTIAMFLSQGAVLAVLGALLVLPLVLIVPRRRWVIAVSFVLALTGLILTVVDGYVWQQYRLHLDASIWNLVTGGAFGETFVFATRTWLKLGFVVLVLGSLLAGCAWLAARMVRRRGRLAGVALAISLGTIFVVHNGIYAWASAAGYTPITGQTQDPARVPPADGEALVPQARAHAARGGTRQARNEHGSRLSACRAQVRRPVVASERDLRRH